MIDPKIHPQLLNHPLRYYLRKFRRWVFVGFFFLIVTNLLDGLWPLLIKATLDHLENQSAQKDINRTILLFFLTMTGLSVTRWGWRFGFGFFHTNIVEDLRRKSFLKVLALSQRFFNKTPVGDLVSIVINDIQTFRQNIGSGILIFSDGIIIMLIILPIMVSLNSEWTWKCLILIPLVPPAIWVMMRRIHQSSSQQQHDFGELSGICQENVSGIRLIKGFAMEKKILEAFAKINQQYTHSSLRTSFWDALFSPLFHGAVAFGNVILVFLVLKDLPEKDISIGTFVAFSRYIQKMVWPMMALGMGLSQFQKGFGAYERVRVLLKEQSEIKDRGNLQIGEFKKLEIRNLSFAYNLHGQPCLDDLSMTIKKGDFVGIFGPVGAGKSTLLQLLLRLYEPASGEILINDLPYADYRLSSLRQTFCLVPQDMFLFSETIKENIAREVSDDVVAETLFKVQLANEISKFPQGIHTPLGEKGVNLSGGQRQRMTLARALVQAPQVIMIDDTLSAVDVETEAKILAEIFALAKGKTLIFVTHRIAPLIKAQKIVVINQGRIEAQGRHEELLISSPTYQQIAAIQRVQS